MGQVSQVTNFDRVIRVGGYVLKMSVKAETLEKVRHDRGKNKAKLDLIDVGAKPS